MWLQAVCEYLDSAGFVTRLSQGPGFGTPIGYFSFICHSMFQAPIAAHIPVAS